MNTVKTALLLGAMTGLLLALGEVMGGREGMTFALLVAGVINFSAWFWSDKVVQRMYNAIVARGTRSVPTYAEVERDARREAFARLTVETRY